MIKELTKPLNANEIELRIGSVSELKGFSLLAYKTARADVKRLNDVCGLLWSNRYFYDDKKLLCCEISVYDAETQQWISRSDVGTESQTEKEKGSYSDAMKRAGFKFGIGVELYAFPFIWIDWSTGKWRKNNKDKNVPVVYTHDWKVEYEGKSFADGIIISDSKGKIIWSNISGKKPPKKETPPNEPQRNKATIKFKPETDCGVARNRIQKGFDFLGISQTEQDNWIKESLGCNLYDAKIDKLNVLLERLEKQAKGGKK